MESEMHLIMIQFSRKAWYYILIAGRVLRHQPPTPAHRFSGRKRLNRCWQNIFHRISDHKPLGQWPTPSTTVRIMTIQILSVNPSNFPCLQPTSTCSILLYVNENDDAVNKQKYRAWRGIENVFIA